MMVINSKWKTALPNDTHCQWLLVLPSKKKNLYIFYSLFNPGRLCQWSVVCIVVWWWWYYMILCRRLLQQQKTTKRKNYTFF